MINSLRMSPLLLVFMISCVSTFGAQKCVADPMLISDGGHSIANPMLEGSHLSLSKGVKDRLEPHCIWVLTLKLR